MSPAVLALPSLRDKRRRRPRIGHGREACSVALDNAAGRGRTTVQIVKEKEENLEVARMGLEERMGEALRAFDGEARGMMDAAAREWYDELPLTAKKAFLSAFARGKYALGKSTESDLAIGRFLVENAGTKEAAAVGEAYAKHPAKVAAFVEVARQTYVLSTEVASGGSGVPQLGLGDGGFTWEGVWGWVEENETQLTEKNALLVHQGMTHVFSLQNDPFAANAEHATEMRKELIDKLDVFIIKKSQQIDATASVSLRFIRRVHLMSLFVFRSSISMQDLIAPKSLADIVTGTVPAADMASAIRDVLLNADIGLLKHIFSDE